MAMAAQGVERVLVHVLVGDAVGQLQLAFADHQLLYLVAPGVRPVVTHNDWVGARMAGDAFAHSGQATGQLVGVDRVLAVAFPSAQEHHQRGAAKRNGTGGDLAAQAHSFTFQSRNIWRYLGTNSRICSTM